MSLDLIREWRVLKETPFTFLMLAGACLSLGLGVGKWYYAREIDTLKGQNERYRVALGIDKASKGNLIELTNEELKAKVLSTVPKLRDFCAVVRKKSDAADQELKEKRIDKQTRIKRQIAIINEASYEIDRNVRSDAYLLDNELRRRLDRRAVASLVNVPPSVYFEPDTPIDILSLIPSGTGMDGAFICQIVTDNIEKMAKLLKTSENQN
jgi:hypothetical protein